MPDINASFSSKYLRAADIGPEGSSLLVTIARISQESMKNQAGQTEMKPIVFFRELGDKGLVLNKTNAKKISTLMKSSDTDDWIDQPIQLFSTETEFGGDTIACIRVKQAALPTKAQDARRQSTLAQNPPPDPNDKDMPF
jgi:hypothetical protein